jgi:succinate dehydrogenase / fumarate reductase cytochrome b subunit
MENDEESTHHGLTIKKFLKSSVGRKFILGLSGAALGGFILMHLAGNLSLYLKDGTTFNLYAAKLQSFGIFSLLAELGLGAVFLVHILLALGLTFGAKKARPHGYKMYRSKGSPVASALPARVMAVTGAVLLLFLVLHIWQFRFGPGIEQGYSVQAHGDQLRDLHRVVVETFKNPLYVGIYVAVMLFLGAHLAHGYWSIFQTLAINRPRFSCVLGLAGIILAGLLSFGFLFIPIWIYFSGFSGGLS